MLLPAVTPGDTVNLGAGPALDDVVNGVLDVVARLMRTRLAVLSRIESTTCTVMAVVDQHHALRRGQFFDLHDTFCVHMLESGQPLTVDDTTHAPFPLRAVPLALELGIRSYGGIPLIMADGRVFGSLWTGDTASHHFTADDRALLQLMARLLIHELDQDAQERHIQRIEQIRSTQSSTDPVTGLLNRDGFEMMLAREVARRSRYHMLYALAVLRLTPPRGSSVSADTLRQELAEILMRTSRMMDCCARIGENDFAVLFAETNSAGVRVWQSRLRAAIDAWNLVHTASNLHLDVHIGITDCQDIAGVDASATLARAEQLAHF